MPKPLILVTGSTGKTGTPVVQQLLERGYPMRAFVHRLDERSQRLSELGAEAVVGDFVDLRSVRRAMKGVKRVYFCYPPQGGSVAGGRDQRGHCGPRRGHPGAREHVPGLGARRRRLGLPLLNLTSGEGMIVSTTCSTHGGITRRLKGERR